VKALTLWQPWASLVVAGLKPYEFRRWPLPRALVGQRIVIHAAARPLDMGEVLDLLDPRTRRLAASVAGSPQQLLEARRMLERMRREPHATPLGAGLGTVVLGAPQRAIDIAWGDVEPADIDPDVWAWPMTDADPWPVPLLARGRQGFWVWPDPSPERWFESVRANRTSTTGGTP